MEIMDWNSVGNADELQQLYDEMMKQESDYLPENNNMTESEATVLLSLQLDLYNRNIDKNGKWEIRNRSSELDIGDLGLGGLKLGETRPPRPTTLFPKTKENEVEEVKDVDERHSSPESAENGLPRGEWVAEKGLQRGDWGPESLGLWHSGPSSLGVAPPVVNQQDSCSVISFTSSVGSGAGQAAPRRAYSHQQLGAKVEMVYNLLSMLGTTDREDMSKTLLAMSSTAESCQNMRQSGCLPLLIQLIHASDLDRAVRTRASEALQNIVLAQTDEKRRRHESRVLKLLQTVREHCHILKEDGAKVDVETHPEAAVAALMKFSFDAERRQAMCTLGGLHAVAELIQLEHEAHGSVTVDTRCVTLRRYAGMALTNLTFGDGANKALLCSFTSFMEALVAQLNSPSEDLRQVTASVVRNLSWRADPPSKTSLREVGAVTALMTAAMEAKKEATLKSILSALWNLSAHCSMNKVDICAVPSALTFLVRTLRFKTSSSTLGIIENAGGILRNVSSHVAVRDDYRQILRDAGCFEVLLEQLKSPSLTVVSNACGTLWNLSARCAKDQRRLWDMGATSMLRSLVQSKHKMIAMGSSAALKNLLAANPNGNMMAHVDSTAKGLGLQNMPTLFARKQRALEQELDATLAETCENIETEERNRNGMPPKRSDSKESVTSTQSDSVYERVTRGNKILDSKDTTLHGSLSETGQTGRRNEEAKLLRRYRTSGIPTLAMRKQDHSPSSAESSKTATPRRGIPVLKQRFRPRAVSAGPSQRFEGTECRELEEENIECPVNYSLQDAEEEPLKQPIKSSTPLATPPAPLTPAPTTTTTPAPAPAANLYAETDLDQPTDFSLKYGEETSSDEDLAAQNYGFYDSNKNDTEDTTHTYYTEGTPYDGTPYNFSSATSMSDLRIDTSEPESKAVVEEKRKEITDVEVSSVSSPGTGIGQRTLASVKQTPSVSAADSGSSSPKRSPAKSIPRPIPPPSQTKTVRDFESGVSTPERPVRYCEEGTPGDSISRVSSLSSLSGKESSKTSPGKKEKDAAKVVTFTVTETPLMFSRSSSLTSLNSLAPPLPDGASSVVSTFSRVTSGAVSPSELPDSPTQTVPSGPTLVNNSNLFDDACQRYKQEGTPLQFSCQTSLSGLSFDQSGSSASSVSGEEGKGEDQTVPERGDRLELASVSEGDEEGDDDILADCISIGMQDTRNRPRMPSKVVAKPRTCLPVKSATVYEDCVQTYHTEDTPANISHASSHSDLSILTFPSQAEDESNNSSDTENILNECIHSGMPQAKSFKEENSKKPNMGLAMSRRILPSNSQAQNNEKTKIMTGVQDEVITFAVENSPCTFSTRSSLSDLTINSELSEPTSRNQPRIPSKVAVKPRTSIPEKSDTVYEDCVQTYHTEDTPANISHAGSHSDLSILTVPNQVEDMSNNSSDTENILNECINSGMPEKVENKVKLPAAVRDDVITFAVENSPCTFSTRSSLSDLTINTESPGPNFRRGQNLSPAIHSAALGASPSSINLSESEEGGELADDDKRESSHREEEWLPTNTRDASFASVASSDAGQPPSATDDLVTAFSRSLSIESFDSCEPTPLEQALLEQCIHSGMPHHSKNGDIAPAVGTIANGTAGASPAALAATELMATSNTWSEEVSPPVDLMAGSQTSQTWSEKCKLPLDAMVASIGTHTWSDDASLGGSGVSGVSSGSGEVGLHVVDSPRPAFRLGAGVTPSPLARDVSRVCRDLRKVQEQDQLSSVTSIMSELSLVSCDSFLDVELVGLEVPDRPTPDFLASEEHPVTLKLLKLKNESLSIQSFGHPDVHVDFDLDHSMVSVASITSEIAETLTLGDNSDTEVPDDEDISAHSQESLPLDNPTPKKPLRKLTPKEKRRQSQDRYRTYTLDELKAKCAEEEAAKLQIPAVTCSAVTITDAEKPLPKITPKQRRLNNRSRFLTRTISLEEKRVEREPEIGDERGKFDTYRVLKCGSGSRPIITPPSYETNMTAAERLELMANATLVAHCLTSEDRSLIDTQTYIAKPTRAKTAPSLKDKKEVRMPRPPSRDQSEEEGDNEGDVDIRGARITVPGETKVEVVEVETDVRAVRGRRKPLYSSPALQRPTKSGPPSPKVTPSTISARTAAANSSPSKMIKPPALLVREGTFTKEEPVNVARNARSAEPKTPRPGIPRPASVPSTSSSLLNGRTSAPLNLKSALRPPTSISTAHKRHSSAGSNLHSQTNPSIKRYSASSVSAPGAMKNSSSNHSIKSLNSVKSGKSITTPPQASPEKVNVVKPKTPKKEVTSKIASLWKKVEETKRKEKSAKSFGGKDTRVWITPSQEEEVLVIEQEEVVELTSGKIVRSSTFQEDGRPSKDQRFETRTVRNSGDFSTWEHGNRSDGKNIVSAVVAPYNYSPPQPKSSENLKHNASTTFQNKVTTV